MAEGPRLKAAIEALPFEKPKLALSASVDGRDFAASMREIARRSGRSHVIDANTYIRDGKSFVKDADGNWVPDPRDVRPSQAVPELDENGRPPAVAPFRRREL
jgi:hypothetical protein